MEIDKHYWAEIDTTIQLPALLDYLNYTLEESQEAYMRYSNRGKQYIVIDTDKGYFYYRCEVPNEKQRASDLISEWCATHETSDADSLWQRINRKYEEFLSVITDDHASSVALSKVDLSFNHFKVLTVSMNDEILEGLYLNVLSYPVLASGIAMSADQDLLFPLYTSENCICGYLVHTKVGIQPYKYSKVSNAIWHSGIPEKVNEIIIFSDPKEAISFYMTHQPKEILCIAIPELNHTTYASVLRFRKVLNAKKIICAFTGATTIEGYVKDLKYLAYAHHCNFDMEYTYVRFLLIHPDEAIFSKFYKKIQEFNNGIESTYKKYNKTRSVNRRLVLKHSIILQRETTDIIACRIPLEAGALKYMVWAYQKFFCAADLRIIKPDASTWNRTYLNSDKSKNESLTSFNALKIAI